MTAASSTSEDAVIRRPAFGIIAITIPRAPLMGRSLNRSRPTVIPIRNIPIPRNPIAAASKQSMAPAIAAAVQAPNGSPQSLVSDREVHRAKATSAAMVDQIPSSRPLVTITIAR